MSLTSLTFGGVEYLSSCVMGSLSISKETDGGVHTLSCQIEATAGACPVSVGAAVVCTGYSATLFTGYVSRTSPKLQSIRDGVVWNVWTISCQDDTRYMEATQTGQAVFDNVYDGEILRTLAATYLTGFDTSNVSDIILIPAIDLSGKTIRECFDEITKMAGAIWYLQPGKVLWYHSIGDVLAPFGLAADADGVSAKAVKADDLEVTEEFTRPVNKCYVRNMLAEAVAQETYTPAASGDDGDVQRASSTSEYPPTGAYTVTSNATTMVARRQKVMPSTGQLTRAISGSQSGHVYKSGASYPPGGDAVADPGGDKIAARTYAGGQYDVVVAVLFFDTSALPDDCEVTGCQLDGDLEYSDGGDGAQFSLGWYNGSNAPVSVEDYTSSTSESAYSYTNLSGSISLPLALKSPNSYVSRTGYTGLRMFIKCPDGAPSGANYAILGSGQLIVDYSYGGTSYKVTCALVRFDTAALPATAEVTGATLSLKITAKADADAAQVGLEWISDPGALGNEDWTNTPAETAYAYKLLSELSVGSWSIPLLSPAANIALAGYTALRIHIKTPSTPTGDNSLTLGTVDSVASPLGDDHPTLVVSYVPGAMIEGDYSDAASIAAYGTFEKSILNTQLVSEAEADLQAQGEVLRAAYPTKVIKATCSDYGLDIGQHVHFLSSQLGLNASYVIRKLQARWITGDELQFTIEAGDYRPDLIRYLRGAT